jgi:uncharacterized protein with von Willebrand factor type A (vWA) domain
VRARLLGFVNALRDAGIAFSVSETLDATHAAAALGIERATLREALAATLVKDHGDRPTFDAVFDRHFGAPRRRSAQRKPRAEDGDAGSGGEGEGRGRKSQVPGAGAGDERRDEREQQREHTVAAKLALRRALLEKSFEAMDPRDVDELRDLVAALARRYRTRWSRRTRGANTGRIDMRRTIRHATTRGGVPLELFYRRRRPGKSDLVALVDLSYSTATAAGFLLALLTPARQLFRHVHLLGYVDAFVALSYEQGHIVPHNPLDLNARSDFGRVLGALRHRGAATMNRNTVLLILGDARNNRRPPRADILAAIRHQVRSILWLNPEPRERWDTGDSVMATYARHCTHVLNAWNVKTLTTALERLTRLQA